MRNEKCVNKKGKHVVRWKDTDEYNQQSRCHHRFDGTYCGNRFNTSSNSCCCETLSFAFNNDSSLLCASVWCNQKPYSSSLGPDFNWKIENRMKCESSKKWIGEAWKKIGQNRMRKHSKTFFVKNLHFEAKQSKPLRPPLCCQASRVFGASRSNTKSFTCRAHVSEAPAAQSSRCSNT